MIIPEWLFKEEQEPIKNKIKKVYNSKPSLKQKVFSEKEKELAKSMIIPYYFIDEKLKIGFKINLESHNVVNAISV